MSQNFNDYDSSGPRPPIPGEETAKNYKVSWIWRIQNVNFLKPKKYFLNKKHFLKIIGKFLRN